MTDFSGVSFNGVFRDYQRRVLDNSSGFLDDNKINIVAAPGSGKTVLGLELIRRLNSPCIVLSPTTTIRGQWGKRFEELFLSDKTKIDEYVSYDLNEIKLINSITYQALYSAVNKIASSTDDEEIDYSNVELFQLIKSNGIKTICLDEAHHLKNEWQKALEKFVKVLDKDVTVISLTATPPYDASAAEWNRYISVCGDIDEEIFVPELVKEKTLCPHQDYVIFNYPTRNEEDSFRRRYENSLSAVREICSLKFFGDLGYKIEALYKVDRERIYADYSDFVAVFVLLNHGGYKVNKRLFYKLTSSKQIPELNKKFTERAVNFLLKSDFIEEADREGILSVIKKYGLWERGKASFDLSERQKRELISSAGKLSGIKKIVAHESENLKDRLRMLILTDYIKKEGMNFVGKGTIPEEISVVSIFETLRREYPSAKIGCLSGSLVILPVAAMSELEKAPDIKTKMKCVKLENADFYSVTFKGQNREKVDVVSKLFENGQINVLIGTQALLGEGWDSPCVNSLILASCVGSFMLSNQMRGRAIRTYKKDPEKTSNIFHLVTVEPDYIFEDGKLKSLFMRFNEDKEKISSCDFYTVVRRFDCFVGPNYDTGEIESGIDRITAIKPPYSKDGIEKINVIMFSKSKDREGLKKCWEKAINVSAETHTAVEVPKQCRVPAFTYHNIFGLLVGCAAIGGAVSASSALICSAGEKADNIFILLAAVIISLIAMFFMGKIINLIIRNFSPKKSITSMSKAILNTLKDLGEVGEGARLVVSSDKLNSNITVEIKNASIHEQNIFNEAIKQLLSPIENPRYVIIGRNIFGGYDYKNSFACPSLIAKNDFGVKKLRGRFKTVGKIDVVYAYNETGKKLSFKCRKKSYITKNEKAINKKYKLTKFE